MIEYRVLSQGDEEAGAGPRGRAGRGGDMHGAVTSQASATVGQRSYIWAARSVVREAASQAVMRGLRAIRRLFTTAPREDAYLSTDTVDKFIIVTK